MNNNEFQLLKQYLGTVLINYILNTNNNITQKNLFEDIEFTSTQKNILDELFSKIKALRINFVNRNGFGDFLSTELLIRAYPTTKELFKTRISSDNLV